MILFNELEKKLLHIGDETNKLIEKFRKDLSHEDDIAIWLIEEEINRLTTFEYLWFLKEVLKYDNCCSFNLSLMFRIYYKGEEKDLNQIRTIHFLKQQFKFSEYGIDETDFFILNPFQKLSLLYRFSNSTFAYRFDSYTSQIRHSLEGLFSKNNKEVKIHHHSENGFSLYFKLWDKDFDDSKMDYEPNSDYEWDLLTLEHTWNGYLGDDKYYHYYSYENSIKNLIDLEIQSIKKMSFYYQNTVDYKIYSPLLVDSLNDWEMMVYNDILLKPEEFESKKSFYLECLNLFEIKTGLKNITKHEFAYTEEVEFDGEQYEQEVYTDNIYSIGNLKEWINKEFVKYSTKKKKPNKKTPPLINFSKDFKVVCKIFEVLFEKNNALDNDQKDRILSFVYRNCNCQMHPKSLEGRTDQKIHWQSKELAEDFVKLFLHLIHKGVITTNKKNIFEKISTEFKGANNGLGFSTLKNKFQGSTDLYKKADEITFLKSNSEIKKEINNILKNIF